MRQIQDRERRTRSERRASTAHFGRSLFAIEEIKEQQKMLKADVQALVSELQANLRTLASKQGAIQLRYV